MSEVVHEALETYVASQADVDRIMNEHRWLLDELATR
jgi:hypothetical protein